MDYPFFDEASALQNLKDQERKNLEQKEKLRVQLLAKTFSLLQEEFKGTDTKAWLIGSITSENQFSKRSDIDIVVQDYLGDRYHLWSSLEKKIGHEIEILRYEECAFQDDIMKYGLRVI